VFGQVIEGLDVVEKIQAASTDENDRPVENIRINKVVIERLSRQCLIENGKDAFCVE
jgi:cyclophilin family peptidyl-prolyl cis-trans isomerase